ncbi:hypothetical protein O6H91_18G070500 [Diphasiastrum complanatum]|uniref:Uncharacterized protein n=1 Tax=Diphasiastrum complanatum TaxID=34168 RepID=A0ACC2B2B5_DIPCM|nr:hypothetical protein O6H91_18G070500 [Diphasiastrum complanatum]
MLLQLIVSSVQWQVDRKYSPSLFAIPHLLANSSAAEPSFKEDIDACKVAISSFALSERHIVVGCGTVSLDYLAKVASFPQPDEKIRAIDSQVQGGGNVGNALTAGARLGLKPRLISKVGNDASGNRIIAELEAAGVDTSYVVIADGGNSPFTYVIVDQEKNTRTCIHTPGQPLMEPNELSSSTITALLSGAKLVYFDGRLTDTALLIANEASQQKLPILVDAERKRDHLDELLTFANYIVASAKFPQAWTGSSSLASALLSMAIRLEKLTFLIVTLGSSGCVMLEKLDYGNSDHNEVMDVNLLLKSLQKEATQSNHRHPVVLSSKVGKLTLTSPGGGFTEKFVYGRLLLGMAESIPPEELVDTTGAGDAFIGAIIYSICVGLPPEKMLPLGAVVAGANCRALGARDGLPLRDDARVCAFL